MSTEARADAAPPLPGTWMLARQDYGNGTTSLSFQYNESGLRTLKTVGSDTHRYVYRGSTLVAEIAGSYALYFHHDAKGAIVGFTHISGNTQAEYFYRKNLQGDVIGIVDSTGASVAEYRYDAWGRILEATGTMANINPIRYRGYYYDAETGLYYVSSRYYDPEICRFINADDTSYLGANGDFISYNLFAYCLNNPVKLSDSGGTFAFLAVTAIAGAAIGAIIGGIAAANNGESIWKGAAKGALIGGAIGAGAGALTGIALAGSATATVASVCAGASALSTTIGGAGLAAGGKMIADNCAEAFSRAPQVFWSGGEIAKNTAKDYANIIGGKTLEMTRLGTYLEAIDASRPVWRAASANFANVANNASSAIYSIQSSAGVKLQSIWATVEYGYVSARDIIYGIVS